MKIGLTTNCLKNLETEDALSRLKELGAEVCGVGLRTFYEYRPEFAKKFSDRCGGAEINSVCVSPLNFEAQLFCTNRRVRGDGFYWLDQVLRSAQLFGARYYVLRGAPQACSYDDTAVHLREISDFCSRYGVTLCLENDPKGLYCAPGIFGELKKRCESIAAVFNLANAKKSCFPYQMYFSETVSHLAEVRLDGGADSGEILSTLKKRGYCGAVLADCRTDAERTFEYIKGVYNS